MQVSEDARGASAVYLQVRGLLAHPPVHQEERRRQSGREGRRAEQAVEGGRELVLLQSGGRDRHEVLQRGSAGRPG